MIDSLKHLFQRLGIDAVRFVTLSLVVILLLWLDTWLPLLTEEAALSPLLSSTAIVLAVCAVSHLTRRLLFPSIDLKPVVRKSLEHPIGAAIVFASVCGVLATLISVTIQLLR